MHALGRLRRRSDTLRIVPLTILLSTLSAFLVSVPARAITSADDGIEIDGVTPSATLIERYELFEVGFELSQTYANPFDPGMIAVEVTFTSPTGVAKTMPAFWSQTFEVRPGTESFEVYDAVADPGWVARFAPSEVGTYTYRIEAVDAQGRTGSAGPFTFQSGSSLRPGLVRVDPGSPLGMRFDDGTGYAPLGHNAAFEEGAPADRNGISYYRDLLQRFSPQENWTRIWMTDFNRSALEWGPNHYSGFYDGPGVYSLESAWRMDRILEMASERGLMVQLVLADHGAFSDRWSRRCNNPGDGCTPGEPGYDPGNPYNQINGGPIPDDRPDLFFSDPGAAELFRQRLRYIVSRWGAYANVLAWELFNEVQFVGYAEHNPGNDPALRTAIQNWHHDMAEYLGDIDPFDHLVTTSSDSAGLTGPIWEDPLIDLVQVHDYNFDTVTSARDLALHESVTSLQATHGKPVIIGEFGIGAVQRPGGGLGNPERNYELTPNPDHQFDPATFPGANVDEQHLLEGTHIHNGAWAGALSRSGAMSWWWGTYLIDNGARNRTPPEFPLNDRVFPALTTFLQDEDLSDPSWAAASVIPSPGVIALGLQDEDRALLWVRETANEFGSGSPPASTSGRTTSGAEVDVSAMVDGSYIVDVHATTGAGELLASVDATATGGMLHIEVPDFVGDVALKIRPGIADLSLTKTDPPGRAPTGRNLPYTVTVTNNGPNAASGVTVIDQLPPSVAFVSATPTQGTCWESGQIVTCELGTLGGGASTTINIVVKPTMPGTITNTATVSASTPDPNGDNNSDSEATSVCRLTSRRSSIPCG